MRQKSRWRSCELFDAANATECYRRSESIVPQQALALANSPLDAGAKHAVLAGQAQCQERRATSAFVAAAFETVSEPDRRSQPNAICARSS